MPLILLTPFSTINIATLLNLTVVGASVDVSFYVTSVRYSLDLHGVATSEPLTILTSSFTDISSPLKSTVTHSNLEPMTKQLPATNIFAAHGSHSIGKTLTSSMASIGLGAELSHSM